MYIIFFLQDRDTPLLLASKEGHFELVKVLTESGAQTTAVNKVSIFTIVNYIVPLFILCVIMYIAMGIYSYVNVMSAYMCTPYNHN